ncbi:MAG: hypothetical protein GX922_00600 [Firmicutes bacterium]|nr:hypothetical protein [Bacillota bacterium]
MNFKQLLARYEKGSITEEEKRIVEEEIEKYEALEEFIASKFETDFMNPTEKDIRIEESRKLTKKVNTRLRKVVLTSVTIITLCLLSIFFIISPLVDSFYYNPAKISVGKSISDVNFDLAALIELNQPGYALAGQANVDRFGFASYDGYFYRLNLFTQEVDEVPIKIKRNKSLSKNFFDIDRPSFITIEAPGFLSSDDIKRQKERVMNHLQQLSPVAYVAAYLTFEDDLSMEELEDLVVQKNHFLNFVWAGIRTAPKGERMNNLTGIALHHHSIIFHSGDQPNTEKYPAFNFLEWLTGNEGIPPGSSRWAVGTELHYKSLLKYMIDRKDVPEVFANNPNQREYYQKALDYVEENGVKAYGVLVYATAQDLIKLVENSPVKTLEIDRVLASQRYIQ